MAKELAKQYDPSEVEDRTYQFWCDKKYFHAKREKGKKTYTIVIPPPNITVTNSRATPSRRSSSVTVTSKATVSLPSLATSHPGISSLLVCRC